MRVVMIGLAGLITVACTATWAQGDGTGAGMRRLILDTDIDTDCDDTGAMAIMHEFAQRGEVEILGAICSIPRRACALCASAINDAYGRSDIPVGLLRMPGWDESPRFADYRDMIQRATRPDTPFYNQTIGADWERDNGDVEFRGATQVYRKILAEADDGSVTICAVGTLTALEQLLRSPPDGLSPLPGRDLVAAKVERLVTMALGAYPKGRDGFNWRMDWVGAAAVLNEWPTPVTVSELGTEVLVGNGFIAAAPPDHPVRRAFEIWLGTWGQPAGRPSWDQLATIRAVRGCGDLFREHGGLGLRFDEATGEHEWLPEAVGAERSWIEAVVSDEELARVVESLMIDSLTP